MIVQLQGHPIDILYEDNHLILAVKPAGVLSQSDASRAPDMLTLLKGYLRETYNKPGEAWLGLVHRLDQPVSGVMVFAKTSKAASRLSEQVRRQELGKYYLAVVEGAVHPAQGVCRDVLAKNEKTGHVRVVSSDADGKPADLRYRLIETVYKNERPYSLLLIRLGSGRSHQIRVQLAFRGWPIVGDLRYREPGRDFDSSASPQNDPLFHTVTVDGRRHADLALHACLLSLRHPVRNEPVLAESLPPKHVPWTFFTIPSPRVMTDDACSTFDIC